MGRQGVAIAVLLATLSGVMTVASAQDRVWPSAPFRGLAPDTPPCTCRAPGLEAEVGGGACLATASGGRRARCVMVQNTTSWVVGSEPCGAVAVLD